MMGKGSALNKTFISPTLNFKEHQGKRVEKNSRVRKQKSCKMHRHGQKLTAAIVTGTELDLSTANHEWGRNPGTPTLSATIDY